MKEYIRIDRSKHPVHEWKICDRIQESNVRSAFQQKYDRIQRSLRPEVSSQRNDEVVYSIRSIVCGQDDGLVLPLVILGIAIRTMLADLGQLETAEWLLFLQQIAQSRTDADEW